MLWEKEQLIEEWRWVFCLTCSSILFWTVHYSLILFFLSTANSLQSLFLSQFSYAIYYWQCPLLCPSSLALQLGWASIVPAALAEVLCDMTDSSHTSPETPCTHTCIRVQCLVLVGVYTSCLHLIMRLRQVQRFALEEEDSRLGIILICCGCLV